MTRRTVAGAAARRSFGTAFAAAAGGNFDQLRLLAALAVLFSHAYVLTGDAAAEPVAWATGHVADGGSLAVSAFFALSGFLVTRSAERRRAGAYVRARVLRIWPALIAAVLVQTFGIGLAATSLPWRAYLLHPQTWRALASASIVVLRPELPGVFAHNPVPGAVNGSLWTLRVELACYVLPLGLALVGGLRRHVVVILAAAALVAFVASTSRPYLPGATAWLADPRVRAALACVLDFLLGGSFYLWRDRVPFGARAACAAIATVFAARWLPLGAAAVHLAWPYLVLTLGLTRPVGLAAMRRLGDVSYGLYLYAFPVQQGFIAAFGLAGGPLVLAAAALLPVLALAFLSSRLVEVPALRLKRAAGGPGFVLRS